MRNPSGEACHSCKFWATWEHIGENGKGRGARLPMPDPHTDAPATAEERALVTALVLHNLGDAAADGIVRLQAAKGGLQYASSDVFRLYVAAVRALDALYQAVK
jgi:hypothetical protein